MTWESQDAERATAKMVERESKLEAKEQTRERLLYGTENTLTMFDELETGSGNLSLGSFRFGLFQMN